MVLHCSHCLAHSWVPMHCSLLFPLFPIVTVVPHYSHCSAHSWVLVVSGGQHAVGQHMLCGPSSVPIIPITPLLFPIIPIIPHLWSYPVLRHSWGLVVSVGQHGVGQHIQCVIPHTLSYLLASLAWSAQHVGLKRKPHLGPKQHKVASFGPTLCLFAVVQYLTGRCHGAGCGQRRWQQ